MKHGWLAFLARPIDGGAKLRGERLFGHTKTFRGPILVAAGSAAVFVFQQEVLHIRAPTEEVSKHATESAHF